MLLFYLFWATVLFIAFNAIYFGVCCAYLHTKAKYQLFALRDSLRRLRIDHPLESEQSEIYEEIEARLNGTIFAIPNLTLRALIFSEISLRKNKEAQKNIDQTEKKFRQILQGINAEINQQLNDIEIKRIKLLYKTLAYNSPVLYSLFLLISFINKFIRQQTVKLAQRKYFQNAASFLIMSEKERVIGPTSQTVIR